jgi:hypothetical protein
MEITQSDSIDKSVIITDNTVETKIEVTKITDPTVKIIKKRKPMSDEDKEKRRASLQKAREAKKLKGESKVETEKQFKEKIQSIDNIDKIIEQKLKSVVPIKKEKVIKDKSEKLNKKKQLIENIVEEKLKGYKQAKQPESDFKLIQKFF